MRSSTVLRVVNSYTQVRRCAWRSKCKIEQLASPIRRPPRYGCASPSAAAYGWIVFIQVAVVVLGTLAATWSTWRITGRELVSISRSAAGVRLATLGLVLGCGAAAAVLYLITHAAD